MHLAVVVSILLLGAVLETSTGLPDDQSVWLDYNEDHQVKYMPGPKSWQEAEDECHKLGADLVKIESEQEMEVIAGLADDDDESVWIGLKKSEGVFMNADGSEPGETLRVPRGPDGDHRNNACVSASSEEGGLWVEEACSDLKPFVCAEKKAIRVKRRIIGYGEGEKVGTRGRKLGGFRAAGGKGIGLGWGGAWSSSLSPLKTTPKYQHSTFQ